MRKMFEQYRTAQKLMAKKQRQLEGMDQLTDTVKGSMAEWPYTRQTVTISGRNASEERELREEIRELEELCRSVKETIRKAPNPKTRMLLELRYVEGLDWEEVAEEMGEDVSGDAMRKRAEGFFKVASGFSENS